MESLAFNIMARIDDVIFVDDATKKCAAAEAISVFNRQGLGGIPLRNRFFASPFSIRNTPYASPFATPTFSSSTPSGSPLRIASSLSNVSLLDRQGGKLEKSSSGDTAKTWSYTKSLSARKDSDVHERD